jgi:hypothetical protein
MKRKLQRWNNRKQSIEVASEYPLSKGQQKKKGEKWTEDKVDSNRGKPM